MMSSTIGVLLRFMLVTWQMWIGAPVMAESATSSCTASSQVPGATIDP